MARQRAFCVDRLEGNPILYRGSGPAEDAGIGANINGPSLIRAPSWLANPLGRYYLYFAHHRGTFTRLAVSADGVSFTALEENLGRPYFRAFAWEGAVFGIAKPGILYRSADGMGGFERGPRILERSTRHMAVLRQDSELLIFYSRIGDAPERILCATVSLTGDWRHWRASEPVEVLAPEQPWEGGDLPVQPSAQGWADVPVRQLRDPAVFEENGATYLLYSAAGESGIAIARLRVSRVNWASLAAARVARIDPGYRLARQALVTLVAVLLSFASALALKQTAGLSASVEVLAVALAISLSRVGARPGHRGVRTRALGLAVLPVVALLSSEVGTLMFQHPDVGDAVFVAAVSATIYVRRFGERARRIATFAVLPLISTLIVPGPVVVGAGHSGASGRWWAALVAVMALGWVTITRLVAERTGWLTDGGIVPARATPRRAGAAGRRRMAGSTKLALQMAAALAGAFALGRWLFGVHWSWCVLTAFIVASGNRGREDVAHKAALRLIGAGTGTLAATLLSGLFPAGDAWAIVVIFGVLAIALWLRSFNYAFWAAGMTAALALLYGYYGEHGLGLLASRLEGILIGAGLAVAAAWLLWPIRSGDVMRRDIGAALSALDGWLAALVEDREAAAGAAHGFRRAVAALEVHIGLLRAIPRPLRARIDHLDALEALERCGRSIAEVPLRASPAPHRVARLRGHARELRRLNGQAVLPDPDGWATLADDVESLLRGSGERVDPAVADRLRTSTQKVLGYVNRTHGLALVLGELAEIDGTSVSYAVADPDGAELRFSWVRDRGVELPAPQSGELARGRTPSGFPYAVLHPAAQATSSTA